jgi:hypothetical protein
MEYNITISIASILYLVIFIAQVVFLTDFSKQRNIKSWSSFLGTTIGTYVLSLGLYVILAIHSTDLGTAIGSIMLSGFAGFVNTIMLVIGLCMRASKKHPMPKGQTKLTNHFHLYGLVVALGGIALFLLIPSISMNATTYRGNESVINYLNTRYGSHGFKVESVAESYSHNGMWDKTADGFIYTVSSNVTTQNFHVLTNQEFRSFADYFLPVYFSNQKGFEVSAYLGAYNYPSYSYSELETYVDQRLVEEYSLPQNTFGTYYKDSIIPDDYGRLPDLDEFIELLAKYYAENGTNSN